jgi:hypothetical protein
MNRSANGRPSTCGPILAHRFLTVLLATLTTVALLGVRTVLADGSLPPLPYRYLHPPPALSHNNKPPLSGTGTFRAPGGTSPQLKQFTRDGLTGITATAGTFRLATGKSLRIDIKPVETPSGLPSVYAVDGNSYAVSFSAQPGNGTVTVQKPFNLVVRWPHIPTAIYTYVSTTWRRICYSDKGVLAGFTLSCKANAAGIFAAVAPPTTTVVTAPNTPIVHSRFAWLDPYIPVLAAAALLLATTILLYFVVWPRRGTGSGANE